MTIELDPATVHEGDMIAVVTDGIERLCRVTSDPVRDEHGKWTFQISSADADWGTNKNHGGFQPVSLLSMLELRCAHGVEFDVCPQECEPPPAVAEPLESP